jgi:hypothetical protein
VLLRSRLDVGGLTPRRTISSAVLPDSGARQASKVNGCGGRTGRRCQLFRGYFQGVTGGTLSVAGGMSTVLKSAGLTISRYSMSGE